MKLIIIPILAALLALASAEYRLPVPDPNDSDALRHYFYDIVRTIANGLVDGYNSETTYFSDLDCYNESFQLTTWDFIASAGRSLLYWEWLTSPISTWNSLTTFTSLWSGQIYRCGKELSADLWTLVTQNNPLLIIATLVVRMILFAPLLLWENMVLALELLRLNLYGVFRQFGIMLSLLTSAHPLGWWESVNPTTIV